MNPAHPICQPLQELVPADSDDWRKLLEVIAWAHEQYERDPQPADGSLRGLDHCKRDTDNALTLLAAFPPAPELSAEEKLVLAISLVVHDVGRAGGSDGHGAQSARLLHEARRAVELNSTIIAPVSEVIRQHDLQGQELKGAVSALTGRGGIVGEPRTGYLALLLKLADLLDTDANRVSSDDSSTVIPRNKRVVRLARETIARAGPTLTKRAIIFRAQPATHREKAAVEAYIRRLTEQEFSPIAYLLSDFNLPTRIEPAIDEPPPPTSEPALPDRSPGLYFFTAEQAGIFRGRADDIDAFCTTVWGGKPPIQRLLGVSGAGKSSLIAAGIIPRLEAEGWQCLHTRPAFPKKGSNPGWQPVQGGRLRNIKSLISDLSEKHQKSFDFLGAVVVLDQLEDLVTRAGWQPAWFREQLKALLAEREWLTTLLSYRAEHETNFGPVVREVMEAALQDAEAGLIYLNMLEDDRAREAILAAPELRAVHVAEDGVTLLVEALHRETQHDFSAFGVYPPYVQMLIEALPDHAVDGVFGKAQAAALLRDGIGALLGKYLHRRLDSLQDEGLDPKAGQQALMALVDTREGGRKGRATLAAVGAEAMRPRAEVRSLLGALTTRRLVRPLGGDEYEIAHDHLARLIAESMTPEQRRERAAVDILRIRARAYEFTHELLTENELLCLFVQRHRLLATLTDEERTLIQYSRLGTAGRNVAWAPDGTEAPWLWGWSHVGRDEMAQACVTALHDKNAGVRRAAAKALGQIGDEAAVQPLLQALGEGSAEIRAAAATALGQIRGEAARDALLAMLGGRDHTVRAAAAEALGQIGDETAVQPLLRASREADEGVRKAAAKALGQIGGELAIAALLKVLGDGHWGERAAAAEALQRIGGPAAVEALLEALGHRDGDVRWAAAEALGKIGGEEARGALGETMRKDDDLEVRTVARRSLRQVDDRLRDGALQKDVTDKKHVDVRRAATALGRVGAEAAVEALTKAPGSRDLRLRLAAATALGHIGGEAAVEALTRALGSRHLRLRQAAATALGHIGSEAAIEALLKASEDKEKAVREAAATALGQIGDEAAVEALLRALAGRPLAVRLAAVKALGQIGDARAVPALTRTLNDHDSYVRHAAAVALCRLLEPAEIEAICDELGHGISLGVATVFDYHCYAPQFLREAFGEVYGRK